LAGYLREKREVLAQGRLKDFGPLFLIWGGAMLVLVETNDLGSALLYLGIFLAMVYVATGRVLFTAIGLALFLAGSYFVYTQVSHVHERVTIWLHPWTDHKVYCALNGRMALRQDCGSFQLVKSLYSIASGGFGGTGLGKETIETSQGHPLIPSLNTDFIYSALAQGLGLIGISALILLFMVFVLRGMRIALLADDGFSKLAGAGLAEKQDNAIQRVAQFRIKRGVIRAADGTLLATNVRRRVDGQTLYYRRYPTGRLFANLVGYSTEKRSRAGLEQSENAYLTSSNANLGTIFNKTLDKLKGVTITGNDLILI